MVEQNHNGLTADDRKEILTGKKLNDRVINAAQSIIKQQFPHQNGLRDTVVLEGAQTWDSKPDAFVQVVFDSSRKHWVCVTNKFSGNTVEIYDSLRPENFDVSTSITRQVATIMKTQEKSFEIRLDCLVKTAKTQNKYCS